MCLTVVAALAQNVENGGVELHGNVGFRLGAPGVRADLDEILDIAVSGQQPQQLASGLAAPIIGDVTGDTGHGVEDIDRREVPLLSQTA